MIFQKSCFSANLSLSDCTVDCVKIMTFHSDISFRNCKLIDAQFVNATAVGSRSIFRTAEVGTRITHVCC